MSLPEGEEENLRTVPVFGSGYPCTRQHYVHKDARVVTLFVDIRNLAKGATGWADHNCTTDKEKLDLTGIQFLIQGVHEGLTGSNPNFKDSADGGKLKPRVSIFVELCVKDAMGYRTDEEKEMDRKFLSNRFLDFILGKSEEQEFVYNLGDFKHLIYDLGSETEFSSHPERNCTVPKEVTFPELIYVLRNCFDMSKEFGKFLNKIEESGILEQMSVQQLEIIEDVITSNFNEIHPRHCYEHVLDATLIEVAKQKMKDKKLEQGIPLHKADIELPEGYYFDDTKNKIKKIVGMKNLVDPKNLAGYKITFVFNDPEIDPNELIHYQMKDNRAWYMEQCIHLFYTKPEARAKIQNSRVLRENIIARQQRNKNQFDTSSVNTMAPTVPNSTSSSGVSVPAPAGATPAQVAAPPPPRVDVTNTGIKPPEPTTADPIYDPTTAMMDAMKSILIVSNPNDYWRTIGTSIDLLRAFVGPVTNRNPTDLQLEQVQSDTFEVHTTRPTENPVCTNHWASTIHQESKYVKAGVCRAQYTVSNYFYDVATGGGNLKFVSVPFPYLTWEYTLQQFKWDILRRQRLPWRCLSAFNMLLNDCHYRYKLFNQKKQEEQYKMNSAADFIKDQNRVFKLSEEQLRVIRQNNNTKLLHLARNDHEVVSVDPWNNTNSIDQIQNELSDTIPLLEGESGKSIVSKLNNHDMSLVTFGSSKTKEQEQFDFSVRSTLGIGDKAKSQNQNTMSKVVYVKSSLHSLEERLRPKWDALIFFQNLIDEIPEIKDRFPGLLRAYNHEALSEFMIAIGEGQTISGPFEKIVEYSKTIDHLSEEKNIFDKSLSTYGNFIAHLCLAFEVNLNAAYHGADLLEIFNICMGVYSMAHLDKENRGQSAFKPGLLTHGEAGSGKSWKTDQLKRLLIEMTWHNRSASSNMTILDGDTQDQIILLDEAEAYIVSEPWKLNPEQRKRHELEKQIMTAGEICYDTRGFDDKTKTQKKQMIKSDTSQITIANTNVLQHGSETALLSRYIVTQPKGSGRRTRGVAFLVGEKEDAQDVENRKCFLEYVHKIQVFMAFAHKMISTRVIPLYTNIQRLKDLWKQCLSELIGVIPAVGHDARSTEKLYYKGFSEALLYSYHLYFCSELSPLISRDVVKVNDAGYYKAKVTHQPFSLEQIQNSMLTMVLPEDAAIRLITSHLDDVYSPVTYDVIRSLAENLANYKEALPRKHTLVDLYNAKSEIDSENYFKYYTKERLAVLSADIIDRNREYYSPEENKEEEEKIKYQTLTTGEGIKIQCKSFLEISGMKREHLIRRMTLLLKDSMPHLNADNIRSIIIEAERTKIRTVQYPSVIDLKNTPKEILEKPGVMTAITRRLAQKNAMLVDREKKYKMFTELKPILEFIDNDDLNKCKVLVNVTFLENTPNRVKVKVLQEITCHNKARARNLLTACPVPGFERHMQIFPIKPDPRRKPKEIPNPTYVSPTVGKVLFNSVDADFSGKLSERKKEEHMSQQFPTEEDIYNNHLDKWYPNRQQYNNWIIPVNTDERIVNAHETEGIFGGLENVRYPHDFIQEEIDLRTKTFRNNRDNYDGQRQEENNEFIERVQRVDSKNFEEMYKMIAKELDWQQKNVKPSQKKDKAVVNAKVQNLERQMQFYYQLLPENTKKRLRPDDYETVDLPEPTQKKQKTKDSSDDEDDGENNGVVPGTSSEFGRDKGKGKYKAKSRSRSPDSHSVPSGEKSSKSKKHHSSKETNKLENGNTSMFMDNNPQFIMRSTTRR